MFIGIVQRPATWWPSSGPASGPRRARCPARLTARSSPTADCCTAELELLAAVDALGYPASIFPGDETARADIDRSIERLEAATPSPSPLRPPSPALLGEWQLVYASDGTYVTRTGAAQALLVASRLPGVGVADIRQALQLPGDADDPANTGGSSAGSSGGGGGGNGGGGTQLRTSNAACFGLGPLGEWEVCIQGVWDVVDASLARVSFTGFDLQLTGLFGVLKLPRMAKVSVPIQNSRSADFTTTYLSDSVRVARGKTRNIFVFKKLA